MTNWPDNTFIGDEPETQHFIGSHWDPFYDDVIDILKRMPEIVERSAVMRSFGSFYPAPNKLPSYWSHGSALAWPDNHHGLIVIVKHEPSLNSVASLYPYSEAGIQTTVTLDKVHIWLSGVEAQISACWGNSPISFFDTNFLNNRCWYESGKVFDFILLGIAYEAKPSTLMEIPFKQDPKVTARLNNYSREKNLPPPPESNTLSLEGMALFMPIPAWDRDDYQFRGPVKSVKPAPEVLGQQGWIVRVCVMRFDADADLDILITRRAWKGDSPPEVDQDIEGSLWLQGRLWSSKEWEQGQHSSG